MIALADSGAINSPEELLEGIVDWKRDAYRQGFMQLNLN